MTLDANVSAAAAQNNMPNYVAGILRDGEVTFTTGGVANADTGAPMTPDTVFRLYSMTKAVTTAAAMQLVERGQADLDGPASAYCGELGAVKVLAGFDDAGQPVLRAPARAITLRDLLLHRAGFGYSMWNADLTRYTAWAQESGVTPPPDMYFGMPLVFDPGEKWEYGVSIDWAGRVVEAISGQDLEAFFADNIFGPLGMTDSTFRPDAALADRLADLHFRLPDGGLMRLPRNPPADPGFCGGGGGLYGTAADYLKFLQAMAGDGSTPSGRILKAGTVAQMAHCDDNAPLVRALPTLAPTVTNDLHIWGDAKPRWSLGFLVNPETGPHGRPPGSLAWAGLANTYYWIDRDNHLAGVMMSQLMPFADKGCLGLFEAVEQAAYA